ncbi:MAG: extracellular solute-binding protein [Lachnospiraceae bacterium]|nr:extracellular solute-binding protein [Lachnospiraceae bacterium]
MEKRYLIRIFYGILLLMILGCTGCSASKETLQQSGAEIQRDDDEPLKFSIWSDEESYVREVVDAYNALKGKEEILLEVIPNSEHEEWINHYSDEYGTDIIDIRGNTQLLFFQKQDKLLGLSKFIRESGLDIRNYGTMVNEITWEGEYYALPTRSTCWVLYYNKELFAQMGVPEPGQMTWEEYLELAISMSSRENEIWGGYYPPWIYHIPAIQKGYYLLDDDLEPVRDSMDLMQRIYSSGSHLPFDEVKDRGDYCRDDFEKGNIAMIICGEWLANMFLEDEADGKEVPEWGIAPLPVPEGVEPDTSIGMYQFAGITSVCKDPERAYEFLEFLCGPQGAQIYARNAIIPGYSNQEIQEIYMEAVGTEQARVFFDVRRIQEQPMWDGYDQLTDLFKADAREFLEGKYDLDHLMELFEEQRKEVFR